jgi:predicted RNA binding protein YcfA (HicA-like mRNA interferase family)
VSGVEKLIKKFLNDKTHITVEDCDRILLAHGFELKQGKGSHRAYHKKGAYPIVIVYPKKSKYVVSPYVNRIIKDLGLEEKDGTVN